MRSFRQFLPICLVSLFFFAFAVNSYSASVEGVVRNEDGEPVADAVVYAISLSGNGPDIQLPLTSVIDQVDKEFIPYVNPVLVNTEVHFPNNDKIRHHVYSFSEAKTFELPLYPPGQGPEEPVVFDTPGVVVLGCNIHDWMKAYVFVLETPFYAKTGDDGLARIPDLPAGPYEIQVWHPRLKQSAASDVQQVTLADEGSPVRVEFAITLKQEWRAMRAPKLSGGIYR